MKAKLQPNETVYVTGKGMREMKKLLSGLIFIGSGIFALFLAFLGIAFTGRLNIGVAIVGIIAFFCGICAIFLDFFRASRITITVSNLRITGKYYNNERVNVPLGQIDSVEIQYDCLVVVYRSNPNTTAQRRLDYPRMANTEQIYNAIYSLISAPPVHG